MIDVARHIKLGKATGGVISDYVVGSDVYRAHVFTSSGTFDVRTVDLNVGSNGITLSWTLLSIRYTFYLAYLSKRTKVYSLDRVH